MLMFRHSSAGWARTAGRPGYGETGGRRAGSGARGPARRARRTRRAVGTLLLVALVLAAAGACRGGVKGLRVLRVGLDVAGVDPFTPTVGTDQQDVVRPDTGGSIDGNTPGLYGGTRDNSTCDAEKLIAFLEANSAKAAAWASVRHCTGEFGAHRADRH